jgi:hypothetical protein
VEAKVEKRPLRGCELALTPVLHVYGSNLKIQLPRKEVIQPHLPVRLPCYDFVPVTRPTFGGSLLAVGTPTSGVADFHDVTGGVYKARERIQRTMADARLLATPTSCRRVAAGNLHWGCFSAICSGFPLGYALLTPIVACVSPRI